MNANASNGQTSTTTPTSAPSTTAPFQEATPAQLLQWLRSGEAVLIDVREPDEFAREHIAGATLLPLSRFDPAQAISKAKPGQRIVMQCKSGRRSADACRLAAPLAASGLPVFTLAGGIEAWKKDNLPVELNTKISGISVMRQVQLVIGLCVLAGSSLAWFVDPRFVGIPAFFGAGLTFAGASGTCALATVIGWMPWNKAAKSGASCTTGSCG
jgi:rhodanese-related sulfurtransferase